MKYTSKLVMTCLAGLLLLSLLCGTMVYRESIALGSPEILPFNRLEEVNGQDLVPPSDVVRAEACLLRGDYQQVEILLNGKILSPRAGALLLKSELALGNNTKARLLINENRYNPLLAEMRGTYLANMGYYGSAWEWLHKRLTEEPPRTQSLELVLAEVALKLGKTEEAEQILQKLDGSLPEVMLVKADLAMYSGNFSAAWDLYSHIKDQGYLTRDNHFLTKLGIAGVGSGKDWAGAVAQIHQQAPDCGLADYLEALGALRQGDRASAMGHLQSAQLHALPDGFQPVVAALYTAISARTAAEPAIQALIAQGGH